MTRQKCKHLRCLFTLFTLTICLVETHLMRFPDISVLKKIGLVYWQFYDRMQTKTDTIKPNLTLKQKNCRIYLCYYSYCSFKCLPLRIRCLKFIINTWDYYQKAVVTTSYLKTLNMSSCSRLLDMKMTET